MSDNFGSISLPYVVNKGDSAVGMNSFTFLMWFEVYENDMLCIIFLFTQIDKSIILPLIRKTNCRILFILIITQQNHTSNGLRQYNYL
jgi:hypothetical protein